MSSAHHRDNEISVPCAAFGTAQQSRPVDDGHSRAVMRDQRGNVWFDTVIAALAPHDQPN
jgi:hypothetical protein